MPGPPRSRGAGSPVTSAEGPAPPLTVFAHIPKTGGTTLGSAIRREYGSAATLFNGESILDHEHQLALVQSALDAGRQLRAVVGHFLPGVHTAVGRDDARYVTLLRDPVDRVLSHYHHSRRHGKRHSVSDDDDLAYYLRTSASADNLQTRVLAARFGAPVPPADAAALARAKATLEGFAAVGLTERFTDSVLLFADQLDWRFPRYRKKNRNPAGKISLLVTEELRAEAARRNHLDLELYEWARRRFESDLDLRTPRARVRAAAFPVVNELVFMIADTRRWVMRRRPARTGPGG